MIERLGRGHPLEFPGRPVKPRPAQQLADRGEILLGHGLFPGVGPQRVNLPPNIDHGFIERVAQPGAGVAANHQAAGLGHEGGHVAHVASHYDVAALQGNAAAGGSASLDEEQAPMGRGPGALGGESLDPHLSRHHVFPDAPAHVPMDHDPGLAVHASQEIAGVAPDIHLDGRVQSHGDVVEPVGVEDLDSGGGGGPDFMMEEVVEPADRQLVQVDRRRGYRLHE